MKVVSLVVCFATLFGTKACVQQTAQEEYKSLCDLGVEGVNRHSNVQERCSCIEKRIEFLEGERNRIKALIARKENRVSTLQFQGDFWGETRSTNMMISEHEEELEGIMRHIALLEEAKERVCK